MSLKTWLHDRLCPCTLSGMTAPPRVVYGLAGDDGVIECDRRLTPDEQARILSAFAHRPDPRGNDDHPSDHPHTA